MTISGNTEQQILGSKTISLGRTFLKCLDMLIWRVVDGVGTHVRSVTILQFVGVQLCAFIFQFVLFSLFSEFRLIKFPITIKAAPANNQGSIASA